MPVQGKPSGEDEPVEDLEENGATFKVQGPGGKIEVVLPPLDSKPKPPRDTKAVP